MTLPTASKGFTLIEMLLALGIAAIVTTTLVTVTFQIVKGNARVNNRLLVINDLQNAAQRLYIDGERAQSTDLVDGADPVNAMALTWTEDSANHQSDYYLSGTELLRNYDGGVITVGRNVTDVKFSLAGRLITIDMSSSAGGGDVTKQVTYLVYLRPTE